MNLKIGDIVKNDLCTGCGMCVSESSTAEMMWDEHGFLVPNITDQTFNENAVRVCPFNPKPDIEVNDEDKLANIFLSDSSKHNGQIGRYENTYAGYANQFRETSSSGGIATYIFEQLLNRKIVDALYIVKETNGSYAYQLFRSVSEIKQISKTRYIPVSMDSLFRNFDEIDGKIAISGVACFIKAIRLKQHYRPELKEKIPFLVGIICGGLKSHFFTDYLAQSAGIDGNYHKQEYRIKDAKSTAGDYSFGAFDEDDQFLQMKMRKVGDMWGTGLFKNNACDFCDDVTTELADISVGDAWIEPYSQEGLGTSIIITRSKLADQIVREGVSDKSLMVEFLSESEIIHSQRGSYNHRHNGLKYRIAYKKKKNKLTPLKRKRFLKNIPIYFQWVQKQRLLVREKSLVGWKTLRNADAFNEYLLADKVKLKKLTLFYHRIRKIKKILLK